LWTRKCEDFEFNLFDPFDQRRAGVAFEFGGLVCQIGSDEAVQHDHIVVVHHLQQQRS